jgi:demethylmenaquinone methyltransferase/2-methoxy-6-polyprenyl-1,4-benzoquinol methylase
VGAIASRDAVRAMFDRIVPRYDLLNRLMTGGRDVAWRRLVVREALRGRDPAAVEALDVATGTGDLALALAAAGARRVTAVDFAPRMLEAAQRKAAASETDAIEWVEADAMALPFPVDAFDVVTVGFGLRNMPSYEGALGEMARVLKPGGRLVCLETTPLTVPLLRRAFAWYFSHVVPKIGAIISGDPAAYAYLPRSAAAFPDADALGRLMLAAGFTNVRYRRLGAGTVAVHVAVRDGPSGALSGLQHSSGHAVGRPATVSLRHRVETLLLGARHAASVRVKRRQERRNSAS